jgi:hypothetical protein
MAALSDWGGSEAALDLADLAIYQERLLEAAELLQKQIVLASLERAARATGDGASTCSRRRESERRRKHPLSGGRGLYRGRGDREGAGDRL